jgi:hypothetical protein
MMEALEAQMKYDWLQGTKLVHRNFSVEV